MEQSDKQLACYALRKLTQLKLCKIGKLLKMKYKSVYRTVVSYENKMMKKELYKTTWDKFKENYMIHVSERPDFPYYKMLSEN